MGRKFRLSVHRKNEERLAKKNSEPLRLMISIPLDAVVLPGKHNQQGAGDGVCFRKLCTQHVHAYIHTSISSSNEDAFVY